MNLQLKHYGKVPSYSESILGGQSFLPLESSFAHVVLEQAFLSGGRFDEEEVLEAGKEVAMGPGWEALHFLAADSKSVGETAVGGSWSSRRLSGGPRSSGVAGLEVASSKYSQSSGGSPGSQLLSLPSLLLPSLLSHSKLSNQYRGTWCVRGTE